MICAAALFAACVPSAAAAQQEMRFGVSAHNVAGHGEGGASLEAEYVGAPLRTPQWLHRPRPFIMASANLEGDTSYAAAGLYWRAPLSRHWALEPGVGLAIHDGALHNPYPRTDPRAHAYDEAHQLLGTRVLVRSSLTLMRDIGSGRRIGLRYEHLSNGGDAFGHRDNQSLNQLSLVVSAPLG